MAVMETSRRSIFSVFILLFFSFPSLVPAEEVLPSNILDVYQAALKSDPTMRAVRFGEKAGDAGVVEARASLLPRVFVKGEYKKTKQKILSSDNAIFALGQSNFPTKTISAGIVQPLFDYAAYHGYTQSKLAHEHSQSEVAVVQQELMNNVAKAYFEALSAMDDVENVKAERRALMRHLELAKAKSIAGLGAVSELKEAEARLSYVEAMLLEAEFKARDSIEALSEMTGYEISSIQPLSKNVFLEDADSFELDSLVESSLVNNRAIESRQLAVSVAEEEVSRQMGGYFPVLTAMVNYERRKTDGTLFGGGSNVQTLEYAVQLEVPIFEGGGTWGRTQVAKYRAAQAREDLEAERRSVARKARSAYLGVVSGARKVVALKDTVEARQVVLETMQEGYFSGVNSSVELLDAQRDLYASKRDYSKSRYDYLLNRLALKHVSGALSESDMEKINSYLMQED